MRPILCSDKKVSLACQPQSLSHGGENRKLISYQDDIRGDDPTSSDDYGQQQQGLPGQADRVRVPDLLGDCSPQMAPPAEVSWWEILLR